MPERASWTEPTGGFFTWVTVPGLAENDHLLRDVIEQGIVLVPGSACYEDGRPSDAVRLAFSGVSPVRIREGVKRFAQIL